MKQVRRLIKILSLISFPVLLFAQADLSGKWRFVIMSQDQEIPFIVNIDQKDGSYQAFIQNAEEQILLDEFYISQDYINIPMHIFDSEFNGQFIENEMTGTWRKNGFTPPYELVFEAKKGDFPRFDVDESVAPMDFSGKWEVTFQNEDGSTYPALGIFEQNGNLLTATFLTETGDYRFLEGIVEGSKMKLSAFDGEHAFLFQANMQSDETVTGEFWAGRSSYENWTAKRNESYELRDAESLTYLKEGYEGVEFSFPDMEGNPLSFPNEKYEGKVVILQIFGSWCPNCMDETKFYVDWYNRHSNEPVEIIGLAYERSPEFEIAQPKVQRMIDKLSIPYDFVIAGVNDKAKASETLPMLSGILSFPTSIFIDKQGKVRRIHTGFTGPGTGIYYEQFVEDFNLLMDKLLNE